MLPNQQDPQVHQGQQHKQFHWMRSISVSIIVVLVFLVISTITTILSVMNVLHVPWLSSWFTIFVTVLIPVLGVIIPLIQWLHSLPAHKAKPHSLQTPQVFSDSVSVSMQPHTGLNGPTFLVTGSQRKNSVQNTAQYTALTQERGLIDWGEAPQAEVLYGRGKEIAQLQEWIVEQRCRMVLLLGIGGIGKTSLARALVDQVKDTFSYVFWRSLQNAPPLKDILQDCIHFLSHQQQTTLPEDEEGQISLLLEYFCFHRCLIILDNVESILQAGIRAGHYRQGYEGYRLFIQRVGEREHHSCLVLTSRESVKEIAILEAETAPTRSYRLEGLRPSDGKNILRDKGLQITDQSWKTLIDRYSGNPLALKLVSAPIREVFKGNIAEFLKEGETVVDILSLLDQQFHRLSESEQEVLYWLAIEREAVSLTDLRENIMHPRAKKAVLEPVDSLRQRSMIEMSGTGRFTLQPVILEYVTDKFVEETYKELEEETFKLFERHALMKAEAKEYVRKSQMRLILGYLADRLVTALGKEGSEMKLKKVLLAQQKNRLQVPGYLAGNAINLLIHLNCDLTGYDFSHLFIRQAYLQNASLRDVNFADAHFAKSVFTDTFGSILSVAVSPDGKLLAASTANGEVRLWHSASRMPHGTYQGHTDWVATISFSPDGKTLVSGSDDQTMRLWDTRTGQCLQTLQQSNGSVYSVAFSPDGHVVASGGEDQMIRLWELSTGQCLTTLQDHADRIWSVVFSPDGRFLASGSEDQTIRLWDLSTNQCLNVFHGHVGRVWSVAFSPDSRMIASGGEDHTLRLWDVNSGQCLKTFQGHLNWIRSVAFGPSGSIVASGSEDQMARVWDLRTSQCLKAFQGHSSGIRSVAFSPDESVMISGSQDRTVRVWDVSTSHCLKTFQGYSNGIYSVAFSPDGRMIASGGEDRIVRLWDVNSGQCLKTFQGDSPWIYSIAYSPDGKLLAHSEYCTIRVWDVSTGQCLKAFYGHTRWVESVAFSPDGRMIASGGEDRIVRLWDVNSGQCLKTFQGHLNWIRSVAFGPSGKVIVSGGDDRVVRLWELSTGQCLGIFQEHSDTIYSVACGPDGKLLASGSGDQTARVWNLDTGQCLKTFQGHVDRVYSIALSPDSTLVASGSLDKTVRVWNRNTGQCLKILQGHKSWICVVTFSPDGKTLASCSHDGTIKLWGAIEENTSCKTFKSDRPYERMNIKNVQGLTIAQKNIMKELGALTD